MDIWLIETEEGSQVRPETVHGMLWLQTHFEKTHWESIAAKQVRVPIEDAKILFEDAKEAGLRLTFLPSLSIAGKP